MTLRNFGGLEHSDHTATLAVKTARAAGLTDPTFLRDLEFSARVHDLGKISVSDLILRKPAPLTPTEWLEVRRHPEAGAQLLELLTDVDSRITPQAVRMVREHHERYNGGGYPSNLRGEAIHIGARLITMADHYSAMTTSFRVYRPRLTPRDTLIVMRDHREQYDPGLLAVFLDLMQNAGGISP